ncbi:MAG: serine hydrolase domain-containing protein [Bacteroidota bacterium]
MLKSKITLLFFSSLLIVQFLFAQRTLSKELLAKIDEVALMDVPTDAPGVAVGIVENGKIIYTRYGGYANLETEVKIGPDVRFNIASNGKQFTALAILKLIDQGKIQLSDDIRKFFPDMYTKITDPITIEHLITHTSGVRDISHLLTLQTIKWWKQNLNNKDIIDILQKQEALNFKPGSQFLYSNSNYVLLAEIVEKVSNKSFRVFTDQMFQDLGMPNTSFETNHKNIKGPIAKPYFNFDSWSTYEWIWDGVGDGNLFTTLIDQMRWEQILQGMETDALSSEAIQLSQQPICDKVDYGYGLEFSTYNGEKSVYHHGSTGAWKATFLRFPELKLSIITMSNSGKTIVENQNQKVADLLLMGEEKEGTTSSLILQPEKIGPFVSDDQLLGNYQTETGFLFRFVQKKDGIYLLRNGRNDTKLIREEDNIFHQWNDPTFKQEFTQNEKGEWMVTAYHTSHNPYSLTKIEADFSNFNPEHLQGTFLNEETGVVMKIEHKGDNKFKLQFRNSTIDGILLTPNEMLVQSYKLKFNTEEQLTSIYLDGGRIKNVLFARQ